MPGRNIIKIAITGDAKGLKRATGEANRAAGSVKKKWSGVGGTFKKAFSVVGIAGGAAFLGGAVKSAIAGEAASAKLAQGLKKVTHATKDQIAAAGKFITKTSLATGVTKGELRPAFLSLVTATGSVSAAQKLLGTAMNTATGTGKPLSLVALAVGKAYNGNTTALKKFVPQLKSVKGGTEAVTKATEAVKAKFTTLLKAQEKVKEAHYGLDLVMTKVHAGTLKGAAAQAAIRAAYLRVKTAGQGVTTANMKVAAANLKLKATSGSAKGAIALLNKTFGGQTQKAAETTAGKMARLKVQFGALQAKIGAELLPVINKLADLFLKHTGLVVALVAAIAGFAVLNKVVGFVRTTRKTMMALNTTMAANPAVLIALAIVALGAALYLAYKKVKWFRTAVDLAWQALQTGFRWIKKNWPLLLAIITGPIGLAVLLIVTHWQTIKNAVMSVFDWVKKNWPLLLAIITGPIGLAVLWVTNHFGDIKTFISDTIDSVVGFFSDLPGRLASAGAGMFDFVKDTFKSGINWLIRKWNDFSLTIGGGSFLGQDLPKITIDTPNIPEFHTGGVANFGSRGQGLAWLRSGEGIFTPQQMAALGNRSGNVVINLPAGVSGKDVVAAQKRWQRRNGPG